MDEELGAFSPQIRQKEVMQREYDTKWWQDSVK